MTQESGQAATVPATGAVPEPARPVTPRVRRRIWAEPVVRGWLLLTIGLVIAALVIAVSSTLEWIRETHVVRNGVRIQAMAWHAGSRHVKGMSLANGAQLEIEYDYNGTKYRATGVLYNTGAQYISQTPFDIRIDPENPAIWTNRIDVPPMVEKMMGVGIMLAVAMVCAMVTLLLRMRQIALWVHGDLVSARIIRRSQSALAPNSVALSCAVRVGKTERPVIVYVPQSKAPSEQAQSIDLVVSHDRLRALAVVNYYP